MLPIDHCYIIAIDISPKVSSLWPGRHWKRQCHNRRLGRLGGLCAPAAFQMAIDMFFFVLVMGRHVTY